jgi:membrane protein
MNARMDESKSGPEPRTGVKRGARSRAKLPLQVAPWLAILAMAAFWPRRKTVPAPAIADADILGTPPAPPPPLPAPWQLDAAEPGRGRNADAPWAIPLLGWKDIAWRTWGGVGRHRLPSLAGGVTFYLLLATFPAVAAFVSVYGLFSDVDSVGRQLGQMAAVLPRDAVSVLGQEMVRLATQRHATLGAAFVVSTLISVWSANAGMKSLFDGLNVAYNETEKRPYLHRTIITYFATLLALVFLVVTTTLTVAAPVFLHAVGLHRLHLWWSPLRWLGVYLIAATAFTLVYRHGPSRAPARWRWVFCGGAAAAFLWMAGSLGFSWYLNNFTHFGVTYGSLGAIIGLMLWIWFSLMVVLIGAELNAEIEHQTARDTTTGTPLPLGQRGARMADRAGPAFTISPRQARDIAIGFVKRQAGYVGDFFAKIDRM